MPIIDNYWQTETGWPVMTLARGVEDTPVRLGSPGRPMYGWDVQSVDDKKSSAEIAKAWLTDNGFLK